MRGFILASVGYQVVIPDAIYHGERMPISDYSTHNAIRLFWKVILNNMEESSKIIEEMITKYDGDPQRIGVTGHSMGGFSAAGIFTHNPDLKALVVLNGSLGWENFNEGFENFLEMDEEMRKIKEKVGVLDPLKNIELLKERPILMLHGDNDTSVPINSQRIFYEKAMPMYENKDRIRFIEYPNLNHFVTTNMMEETIIWFHKYI